jgi:glycerol-3-phosphate acyltransferase PlsX
VNGICVIAHSASSSKAIKNAVLESFQFAKEKINHHIEKVLARNREMENENEEN